MDIEEMKKRIVKKYPAFQNIISDTKFIPNEKGHLAYTDGISVYYNPKQIEKYDMNQQLFILSHEVCHIAFDHIGRSKGKNMHLWGVATDSVVNAYLRKDGLKPVPGTIHNPDAIDYDAEAYYEILKEKQKKKMKLPPIGKKGTLSKKSHTQGQGKNSMETDSPPDQDQNQPSGVPEENDQKKEQNTSESNISDDRQDNNGSSSKGDNDQENSIEKDSENNNSSGNDSSKKDSKSNEKDSSKNGSSTDEKQTNSSNSKDEEKDGKIGKQKDDSNDNGSDMKDSMDSKDEEKDLNSGMNQKKDSNKGSGDKDEMSNNGSSNNGTEEETNSSGSNEEDDYDFDEGDHATDNHENWEEYAKDLDNRRKNNKHSKNVHSNKKESNRNESNKEENQNNYSDSIDKESKKKKKSLFQKVKDFVSDLFHKNSNDSKREQNSENISQNQMNDSSDSLDEQQDKEEEKQSTKDIHDFSNMGEPETFSKNREMVKDKLESLKDELEAYSPFAGNTTDSIDRELQEIGKSSKLINWRRLLRDSIRYEVDWSYRHATIEYGVIKSHLEEMPTSETEILLDTSGSINEDLLRNFLKECKNVLASSKVKVGCFDTEFYGFQEIRSMKDIEKLKFTGGGGTDFECAVSSFTKRVDNKIIFTDGYADDPETPMDAIWVVFGDVDIHPKGGKVIHIDADSLKELSTPGYKVYQRGGRV